ncbi:MAG: hypothetical protein U0169_06270 [Polyangiaceae bacterium]
MTRWTLGPTFALLAGFAAFAPVAGCSDATDGASDGGTDGSVLDAGTTTDATATDGGTTTDSAVTDAGSDAAVPDSATDAGVALDVRFPTLDVTRSTRLYAVTVDAQGNVYATGQIAVAAGSDDFATLLVKILPTGALDTAFGTNGAVVTNLAVAGSGEVARGIVMQGTKIVIAGKVEHGAANDPARDIVVLRFDPDGSPDATFGTAGVKRFALDDGVAGDQYGLAAYANGDLLVVGARKADLGDAGTPDGGTIRNELAVLRLAASNGDLVTSFGAGGIFSLGLDTNVSPRTPTILADGTAVIAGYSNVNGQKPLLVKITASGALDTSFGTGGVFFPETGVPGLASNGSAEAYGAALQGTKFVTTGYGKENAAQPAIGWISLRLTASGTVDTTYGDAGHVFFGVNDQPANSRALVVLPDQRIVLLGGASPAKTNPDGGTLSQFAALAVLGADGALDGTYNPDGVRLFDLGGPATGRAAHMFWSGAVAPDGKHVAVVGIRGGITANADAGVTATADQASFLWMPVTN